MPRDSKNCRYAHFGPFSPHATRNVWCCKDCGDEVKVAELTASFAIQLRILDIEQTALKAAHGDQSNQGRASNAPPSV